MEPTASESNFNNTVLAILLTAQCFEKAGGAGASHTGVNTMGQNLVLNLYNCGPHASTVHVIAHYDCVLSITSGGCELAY